MSHFGDSQWKYQKRHLGKMLSAHTVHISTRTVSFYLKDVMINLKMVLRAATIGYYTLLENYLIIQRHKPNFMLVWRNDNINIFNIISQRKLITLGGVALHDIGVIKACTIN